MINWLSKLLKDSKGVATSLVEATATVAVGAVLASVAINGGLDALNASKVEAAKADTAVLGQAILNFFKDNSFYPLFKDATKTGPDEPFFAALVSEQGTYPSADFGDTWRIGSTLYFQNGNGKFGHQLSLNHDSLEGHLVLNLITNGNTRSSYAIRGSSTTDPQRGWAGPYVSGMPRTDPWGNKYMINVQELHAPHIRQVHARRDGSLPRRVVIALSAGPNGIIETSAEQEFDVFQVRGDDIASRIR
jgi:type II secretory pathway pseudopilin PulG